MRSGRSAGKSKTLAREAYLQSLREAKVDMEAPSATPCVRAQACDKCRERISVTKKACSLRMIPGTRKRYFEAGKVSDHSRSGTLCLRIEVPASLPNLGDRDVMLVATATAR